MCSNIASISSPFRHVWSYLILVRPIILGAKECEYSDRGTFVYGQDSST